MTNVSVVYSLISAIDNGQLDTVSELISSFGLSYSPAWAEGYNFLWNAVEDNHTDLVKLLLTKGARVNCNKTTKCSYYMCSMPCSLLRIAVIRGNLEIIEMLLDRGANFNVQNEDDGTPLHNVIRYTKNIEIIKLLLNRGLHVDARDSLDKTPLHIAVQNGALQIVEYLLKCGAYVNSICKEGYTPLHYAVLTNNEEIVKLLLNSNAQFDVKFMDNSTLIYKAVSNGCKNVVKPLLEHGANVDDQNEEGMTILNIAVTKGDSAIAEYILKYCPNVNNQSNKSSFYAALRGHHIHSKVVESFLQSGFHVNVEDANNDKLLFAAVRKGYLKIVEDLLRYGADINRLGDALLLCAIRNKKEKVASLLINHGANVNVQYNTTKTPIFYAALLINHGANVKVKYKTIIKPPIFYAINYSDFKMTKLFLINGAKVKNNPEVLIIAIYKGCIEIVEILLEYVNINFRDIFGRTPLHFIALIYKDKQFNDFPKYGDVVDINMKAQIAKLLLSKGANVNAQTNHGITTLHAASQEGYTKVVEVLLEYDANVNCVDTNNRTPLHFSAENGNESICKMLLDKGADVNAKQFDGITALHIAAQYDKKAVVEVLLKYNAEINSKSKGDITPLQVAVKKGHLKIIEILMKFGADIDSSDEYGNTALHIASEEGRAEIVVALVEYGANINFTNKRHLTPLMYDQNFLFTSESHYPKILMYLKQQVVMMKTANLYVSEKNLIYIRTHHGPIDSFQYKCEEEMKIIKTERFRNSYVTFYDILTKNVNQLVTYARNENIVQVLKSYDFELKFPIYAGMINSHFRKGMERKELLDQTIQCFHSLFKGLPELPYSCIEKIYSYLNNKELIIVIDACTHT